MSGEVIPWPNSLPEVSPGVLLRLESLLAILRAIDEGELLAALPECQTSRAQHMSALRLIAFAERELMTLRDDLVG